MHTQIPSSRGQAQPPYYCDIDKNSAKSREVAVFIYRNEISFKTLCIKFF